MNHATDVSNRIQELRALRPKLLVYESEDYPMLVFKILDKPNTPFWWAVFLSELDAREAWEIWWAEKSKIPT